MSAIIKFVKSVVMIFVKPKTECIFCDGGKIHMRRLKEFFPQASLPIIRRTPHFFTVLDTYNLIHGAIYFLVVPTCHITSTSQLPQYLAVELEYHFQQNRKLIATAEKFFGVKFVDTIAEHGGSVLIRQIKFQSVYHAHIHHIFFLEGVLPDNIFRLILDEFTKMKVELDRPNSSMLYLEQVKNFVPVTHPYLYFRVNGQVAINHGENFEGPSQFLRVALCEIVGTPFMNWKAATEEEKEVFRRNYRWEQSMLELMFQLLALPDDATSETLSDDTKQRFWQLMSEVAAAK